MKRNDYVKKSGFGIRVGDFITDLKKVATVVEDINICVIKTKSYRQNKTQLKLISDSTFLKRLTKIKLGQYINGKNHKDIRAIDVYNAAQNSNFLLLDELAFYSKNPNVFSFFQGYQFDEVEEIDMKILEPFINHVYYIICSGNEECYRYIINWLCYIFQNPAGKTEQHRCFLVFKVQEKMHLQIPFVIYWEHMQMIMLHWKI